VGRNQGWKIQPGGPSAFKLGHAWGLQEPLQQAGKPRSSMCAASWLLKCCANDVGRLRDFSVTGKAWCLRWTRDRILASWLPPRTRSGCARENIRSRLDNSVGTRIQLECIYSLLWSKLGHPLLRALYSSSETAAAETETGLRPWKAYVTC
jgi:hypothetical protein